MVTRLILASSNAKKALELSALLEPLGLEVLPQSQFQVPEAEEPHGTFIENAIAKARHAALHTGLATLADDSGLCVDALGGAPGVLSARFAGEPRSDQRNNELLVAKLADSEDRRAFFYCTLVVLRHAADPQPLIADGQWYGEILHAPRGEHGFGYEPLFYMPELGQTVAELDAKLKNTLSHRAQAMRHLLGRLQTQPL